MAQVFASHMPPRNHSSAPRFDSAKPQELPIYFSELELLFDSAQISANQEKKENAQCYLQYEDFELWGTLPEFHSPTTYEEFKAAVLHLYPGANTEHQYCLADINHLISNRLRVGVQSLEDLSTYYHQFLVITTYLRSKNQIAEVEQQCLFIQGFQPELIQRITQHLQVKSPNHH